MQLPLKQGVCLAEIGEAESVVFAQFLQVGERRDHHLGIELTCFGHIVQFEQLFRYFFGCHRIAGLGDALTPAGGRATLARLRQE